MKNKPYPLYDAEKYDDLKKFLTAISEKYAKKTAFEYNDSTTGKTISITYEKFKNDVDGLGTYFFNKGIKNSNIAIIGTNSYEWLVTYFAAVCGGNTAVPLDKDLSYEDFVYLLNDSEACVLGYGNGHAKLIDKLNSNADTLSNMKILFNINNEMGSLIDSGRKLLDSGYTEFVDFAIKSDSRAVIIYTSGTTGKPKGVMLSHNNLTSDCTAMQKHGHVERSSVLLLPIHHAYGFCAAVLTNLQRGVRIFINIGIKNVQSDIKFAQPQHLCVVPLYLEKFYERIWQTARKNKVAGLMKFLIVISKILLFFGIDLRRKLFKRVHESFGGQLEMFVVGGATLNKKHERGMRDLGFAVVCGYGITECSPVVALSRNKYYREGSAGLIAPGCEMKIENGEILVKGDIVMMGYYKDEAATKEVLKNGWFYTGDLGYIDKDGFLFITGRKKNLIILANGKNISPEELEDKLLIEVEYISEVIVYEENNHITAEVFLNTEQYPDCESRLPADLERMNKKLPIYKRITNTKIRKTEFPKTSTRKIKRQQK